MRRDTLVQLVAGGLMAASLAGSAGLATELSASSGRHKLGYAVRAEDGDPPEVAIGIAMGAFRSLFVNVLWIRAYELKEAGKYYDAMDLARAITRLQPRFPYVWVFQAWNMAYNISVATQSAEERWQWVQNGIRLLRDEGIPANPTSLLLHKELAWIYLHKIGGYTDDANVYYKERVAEEWTGVLGPPPPPDQMSLSRDDAIRKYADWLEPVVNAPGSLEEVIRREPGVAVLLARLKTELNFDPDQNLLTWYANHKVLQASGQRARFERLLGPQQRAFRDMVRDPALAKAWDALIPFLRRRVLVEVYRMEPERMLLFTRKYGPIDWRHPAAHALYWSARGVEEALLRVQEQNEKDYDFANTDRLVIQSVQELYRSGEVYYDPLFGDVITMPNPHFVQTYGDILGELVARSWADAETRAFSLYANGYENFLKDATRFFWRRGQEALAREYYQKLRTFKGQNLNDPDRGRYLSMPIEQFCLAELDERYTSPYVARQEVVATLQGAYVTGLLAGNRELFYGLMAYASNFHGYFMQEQRRLNIVNPNDLRMDQLHPDLKLLAGTVFAQLIMTLGLTDAETIYNRAPVELRQFAYDALEQRYRQSMDEELAAADGASGTGLAEGERPKPFDETFPEPPGMEQFREWIAELAERERQKERQTPDLEIK